MTQSETTKFRDWLKRQSKETLGEVYILLQDEYARRGKNIETDRNFYSNTKDSPEQMGRAIEKYFNDVFDKHHGF
jgi:hypothetical protein